MRTIIIFYIHRIHMSNDNDDDDDDGRTGQQKHNLKTSNKQTKSNIGDAKKREKK
jgi:hypothetical protein